VLKAVLEFALTRRVMVLATFGIFLAGGVVAFLKLNIEAYPNPAPPILEIIAQSPGQSAEEIERFITIPIEIAVASTPGLQYVRSVSLYELSFVRVQFSYDTDYYFALQQTTNKLNALSLPNGVQPSIAPSSLTGEIFRYQLVGPPGYSVMDLKTLETWVLERRLKTVPGVRDVTGWGGPSKEYHVDVDLDRLAAYNLTLPQVLTAMSNSNLNVGGRTLDVGEQSVNIRGIGLIDSIDDIRNIIITETGGVPVYVRDIAKVAIGFTPRLGIAGRDAQDDVVLAVVLMQPNDKTLDVVKRVEAEVARINDGGILPPGVKLVPYYDRGDLVHVTVGTVLHNLIFGIVLIFMIQWVFLGNLRSAIIVAATIPCALFSAVYVLVMRGDSANLLSVGSLDLGIIVDGSVIMVENIFRRLQRDDHSTTMPPPERERESWAPITDDIWSEKTRQIFRAATEVDRSILFSVAITVAAFIPLFTMQGIEGQIFGPMAKTYAYALLGALVAAFTVTPVLSSVLLPDRVQEKETIVVRVLDHHYRRALGWALAHRGRVLIGAAALGLATAAIVPMLGTEFLPKLEEGNLWIRATLPKTISIESGRKVVSRIRQLLATYPEVVTVVSQHGRPDDGTDAAGFFNAEFFAPLKPAGEWPPGVTKDKLVAEIQARLEDAFIGVEFNFSQYIQDNVEEATSGVKGENSVKLFGRDLKFLEAKGNEIKAQMETVKGIEDLGVFSLLGQPSLLVKINRTESARYGLAPADVNAVVQTALAGSTATNIYEGERQFPLVARLLPQYRDSIEAIRNIQIANPNGGNGPATYVPLSAVADISLQSGASYIYRENNERYIPIKFSVRDRDLGSTVAEVQDKVKANVKLPPGYHIEWSGEFGALQEAKLRLAVIVPLSVLLILLLLYSLFNSVVKSLLALTTIPFAACGGLIALCVTGTNFSISSAIGFVSLFGVSVMDGILMLTYYTQLHQAGMPRLDAIRDAAETRMRQILMTAMSACIGLFPAAISTGIGSQVQRPLATVVVGGMLLAPLLTLFVVPTLGSYFLPDEQNLKRQKRRPARDASPEGAPAE